MQVKQVEVVEVPVMVAFMFGLVCGVSLVLFFLAVLKAGPTNVDRT